MKQKIKSVKKEYLYTLLFSIGIWCITLFQENTVFIGSQLQNFGVWIFCRIILFAVIFGSGIWLVRAITIPDSREKKILLYAIPYFILLLLVWFKTPMQLRNGDDVNVFNEVIYFNLWPRHFTYFTGLFNILSLMLIPYANGIVIFKLMAQAICCGYVVEKTKSKWFYLFFLLPPLLDSSWLLQRLYMYGLVYVVFFIKLYMDHKEGRGLDKYCLVTASVLGSVLTIWRREGLVFVILTPILIMVAYRAKKQLKKIVTTFIIVLVVIAVPELFSYTQGASTAYEETATYVRYIQDLLYDGLDREEYAEELMMIDKVVSIEKMDRVIEVYGDASYDALHIRHVGTEWYGMREDATAEDVSNFEKAVIQIILSEPITFFITRMHVFLRSMWKGAALYYGGRNLIQVLGCNIWPALIAVLVSAVYSLLRKKSLLFWFNLNHLFLMAFLFALVPGSYFKYYYVIYLMGYVYIVLFLEKILKRYKRSND